jgi:uncharacterized integral membrane protein
MQVFLFIALAIAAVVVVFAIQNVAPTTVSFLFWRGQSSLALVLLIALAAGVLISVLVSMPSNVRARWTIRQQRKKMTEMETSLQTYKTQVDELQAKLDDGQKKPAEPSKEPAIVVKPAEPPSLPPAKPS